MIVALGALELLGSIVDLIIFPKIVMKNIPNLHCKHDVEAFSKHRPKRRRAMFLSKHHLNIASLKIGKRCIVKNIASFRKVNIAHPYPTRTVDTLRAGTLLHHQIFHFFKLPLTKKKKQFGGLSKCAPILSILNL